MRILRASHLGMCFGVRDAIALALRTAESRPLTILGELVHNETVTNALRAHGVVSVHHPEAVTTQAVMITAHGASQKTKDLAATGGRQVLEATCPLVHYAHRAVQRLAREGYHPIVIGKKGHVEVRGLTEDLDQVDIVQTEADIDSLVPQARFGVVAQTTQPVERVQALTQLLQQRFPQAEVKLIDTVCQPTKQRQAAAASLAVECDVVVVVGGMNSNNTRELVSTCSQHGANVHHVQGPGDLRPEWFAQAETIGLTAGTSTPDTVIEAVEARLRALAAIQMPERRMALEPVAQTA
jgi:4-hydroxy-3-methylbut-2-enyl diphosphate reductase